MTPFCLPIRSNFNKTKLNVSYIRMSSCVSDFYDLVTEWLQSTGYSSGFYKYGTSFVDAIIEQIKPVKKNSLCV